METDKKNQSLFKSKIQTKLQKKACEMPENSCGGGIIDTHAYNFGWWLTFGFAIAALFIVGYFYVSFALDDEKNIKYLNDKADWGPDGKNFGALNLVLLAFDNYIMYMESVYSGRSFDDIPAYTLELAFVNAHFALLSYNFYNENIRGVVIGLVLWAFKIFYSILRHWYVSRYCVFLRIFQMIVIVLQITFFVGHSNQPIWPFQNFINNGASS